MRKFINLLEGLAPSTAHHIAFMVGDGHHEGFAPYWKLNADPKILADPLAMRHIADLIVGGESSGHQPSWELKVVTGDDAPQEDIRNTTHSHVTPVDGGAVIDEEDIDPTDNTAKHKVVSVHQREGEGQGWYECHHDDAELFVVEDEHGEPVESYNDHNSAEAHCHHLNNGSQMLDEIDVDPTDDADMALNNPHMLDLSPTLYSDAADHEVEVAAIHERGHEQDEAFRELDNRGITLTPHQRTMAGR